MGRTPPSPWIPGVITGMSLLLGAGGIRPIGLTRADTSGLGNLPKRRISGSQVQGGGLRDSQLNGEGWE